MKNIKDREMKLQGVQLGDNELDNVTGGEKLMKLTPVIIDEIKYSACMDRTLVYNPRFIKENWRARKELL